MMVSTKGRYALRIMVDLAENQEGAAPFHLKILPNVKISELSILKLLYLR